VKAFYEKFPPQRAGNHLVNEGDDDLYEDNPDGEDDDVITKKRNFGKGQRRKR
jgi:hypothetical protein